MEVGDSGHCRDLNGCAIEQVVADGGRLGEGKQQGFDIQKERRMAG